MDPEIDFARLFEQFDMFLLGRLTFEAMGRAGISCLPPIATWRILSTADSLPAA